MSYPGIDYPKPVERYDSQTRLQDLITDSLHVIADEHNCTVEQAAAKLENFMPELISRALFHATAEAAKDDLCPAGVVVVPERDPDE